MDDKCKRGHGHCHITSKHVDIYVIRWWITPHLHVFVVLFKYQLELTIYERQWTYTPTWNCMSSEGQKQTNYADFQAHWYLTNCLHLMTGYQQYHSYFAPPPTGSAPHCHVIIDTIMAVKHSTLIIFGLLCFKSNNNHTCVPFVRDYWVSQYQKGKTNLDLPQYNH